MWGIIFGAIAVSNNGRAGNPNNPGVELLALAVGLAGLFLIPWGRDIIEGHKNRRDLKRAIDGFKDAVQEERLKSIKKFIENNKGTELGDRVSVEFSRIDKTNVQQLNSVWSLTPDAKEEYADWDEFEKSHQ